MKQPVLSRRRFLQTSAVAAAGLAMPTIIPATALGKGGRPAPSERIVLGLVGYGTIAQSTVPNFLNDPRVQIVAVADPVSDLPHYGYSGELHGGRLIGKKHVEDFYAKNAPAGGYKGCTAYEDFREMFAKEDLDAINLSTPDHWHCAVAILAARKGLHIYGQKPMALTVEEGQRICAEVAKAGVTWQTGSQQRSTAYFRIACEYVRNNRLGKLKGIKVGLMGGHNDWSKLASQQQPTEPPKELNYDLWLGPAPQRPYIPALAQLNWRHNFAFSGGMITDWGAHHIDIVQWALGMDGTGPVKLENIVADLPPADAVYNTPGSFSFDVVYANGVRANVSEKHTNGVFFEGEDGKTILVTRDKLEMNPEDLRKQKIGDGEIKLYESKLHERNFVDCIYSGEPTITPATVAHRSITIAHLANIAIRLGRTSVAWDPAKEQFVDDAKADALLKREMRKGYAV